jgi:hypothetical protein
MPPRKDPVRGALPLYHLPKARRKFVGKYRHKQQHRPFHRSGATDMSGTRFGFRKATNIYREYASFELFADGVLILDMGFSDEGTFDVAFSREIGGIKIAWDKLQDLIEQGRTMAEADRA